MDMIHHLTDQMLERLPAVAAIWHRLEGDGVADLRIQLVEDTWENREAAIDAMLELQRAHIDDLLVNFSFVLPDVAYDGAPDNSAPAVAAEPRVLSFV